jgi:hypothetical protein
VDCTARRARTNRCALFGLGRVLEREVSGHRGEGQTHASPFWRVRLIGVGGRAPSHRSEVSLDAKAAEFCIAILGSLNGADTVTTTRFG